MNTILFDMDGTLFDTENIISGRGARQSRMPDMNWMRQRC